MFRLFLLTLIAPIESGYHPLNLGYKLNNNGYHKIVKEIKYGDSTQSVIKNLNTANVLLQKFCTHNNSVQEVYDDEAYRIKYKFYNNKEDSINIKINHRVIYVIFKMKSGSKIKDVRIIPQGLQIENASWKIDAEDIIVTIPYKYERNVEVQLICEKYKEIPTIIDVPLSSVYRITEYDYRYR